MGIGPKQMLLIWDDVAIGAAWLGGCLVSSCDTNASGWIRTEIPPEASQQLGQRHLECVEG